MKSVAVYCGSASGARPAYLAAARALGVEIAQRGMSLVYGGATVGLMGAVADAALEAGGSVIGVIPRSLVDREIAHPGLTELIVVDTMHERKAAMSARADAFVALPGGFGTMDELFEALTWSQLGIHRKRSGLLDVEQYWQPLVRWVEHAKDEGFVRAHHRELLICDDDPARLLDRLSPPLPR
ncbi:TIGR00730 family Rossman fold protein [Sandaracinus amylolyticus]|uniref:LOG family protein n=1 Tax=Sandaracinus amylolyticus TaxID=927083 RepID=UPI00069DD291